MRPARRWPRSAVANAGEIARVVFGRDSAGARQIADFGQSQPALDTQLVEVRGEGSPASIYGALRDDHPFRATVVPSAGPLQGLAITAGLTRRQAIRSLWFRSESCGTSACSPWRRCS